MPAPESLPNERLALERLVFFSDAVFAIAITLLAFDICLSTDAPQLTLDFLQRRVHPAEAK